MIYIQNLSKKYDVKRMDDSDVESILNLCLGNTLFYHYCEARPTREQILNDLHITPPNTKTEDKYYIGFYENNSLIAVMDLVDGYPNSENAYIGFFMMDIQYQGQGLGSAIITEAAEYLKSMGKKTIRLGIDKGNPQSTRFWKKNGFVVLKEVERRGGVVQLAEKKL